MSDEDCKSVFLMMKQMIGIDDIANPDHNPLQFAFQIKLAQRELKRLNRNQNDSQNP